jgi:hypothetical protein
MVWAVTIQNQAPRRKFAGPVNLPAGSGENPEFATPEALCSYADKGIPKVKQPGRRENLAGFRNPLYF